MSIHDPRVRHHGFVVPNQSSQQLNKVIDSPSTPSQNLDPSFLLKDSIWDQSDGTQNSDRHTAGDKVNVIPSITIPVEYPQHRRDTIMLDDLVEPSVLASGAPDAIMDPWAHLLPGLADLKYQHQQPPQVVVPGAPIVRSAADYVACHADPIATPPSSARLQVGRSHMGTKSTASGSPSTAGAQSIASGDTELTPPSLSDGQQQSQAKSLSGASDSHKRSRSATASKVDHYSCEQTPSAADHNHSRSLSQTTSTERVKIRRSQSTSSNRVNGDIQMAVGDAVKDKSRSPVQSSTGRVPRSRSRPARRASIGPAAHATEVKAAFGNPGQLKIDTSRASKDVSAGNTGPHTVSGVPVPWSASPWAHDPGGLPWPSPFGPSSLPANSPGWPPPLSHHHHPHWAAMYGHHQPPPPELWYSQHMMAVAAAAAGYPLPHPSGTWAFTPAVSLPAMPQAMASASSPEVPADAHMWPMNMQSQLSGDNGQSDVRQVTANTHAGSDGSDAMEGVLSEESSVSATAVPSTFSLEDFLREHKSMTDGCFPPSESTSLDQSNENVDMTDVTVAELSKTAPPEKHHRATSISKTRNRRMSMKSTEPVGRVLEDVPESSALHAQSSFHSGKGESLKDNQNGPSTSSIQNTKNSTAKGVANKNGTGTSGQDTSEEVSASAHSPTSKKASNTTAKKARTSKSRAVRPEAERRKRRRESHNMVERRRRDAINERIAELASLLPETMLLDAIAHSQGGGNNSKVVKVPMPESALHKLAHGGYTSPHEAALDALASAPADSETLAAAQARPNKGIILKKSVDYIRALQNFIEQQATHSRMLQEQMARVNGATDSAHQMSAVLPSSSWSVDRLAHTFDLSHFDASRSAMDGQGPNANYAAFPYVSSAGETAAAGGESPPQTLADWLASNSEESRQKRNTDQEGYDDLFSESGNADPENEDDDGDDSDTEDEDEDEDGKDDDDTLRAG